MIMVLIVLYRFSPVKRKRRQVINKVCRKIHLNSDYHSGQRTSAFRTLLHIATSIWPPYSAAFAFLYDADPILSARYHENIITDAVFCFVDSSLIKHDLIAG